jgi:hypothetical protein
MEAYEDFYDDEDESIFTDDLVDESDDAGVDLLVRRVGNSPAKEYSPAGPSSSSSLGADESSFNSEAPPGASSPFNPPQLRGGASMRYREIGSLNDDDEGKRTTTRKGILMAQVQSTRL